MGGQQLTILDSNVYLPNQGWEKLFARGLLGSQFKACHYSLSALLLFRTGTKFALSVRWAESSIYSAALYQ